MTSSDDTRKQYREGPEAAEKFDESMRRIISVPKTELVKREAAYQKSRRTKTTRKK